MIRDHSLGSRPSAVTAAKLSSLFQQMKGAAGRLATLREHAEDTPPNDIVLEVFQELDSAHEELRTAEEYLHQQADAIALTREALEVEHRRYIELFDSAPDPYIVTNHHGTILEVNASACTLLAARKEFVLGKPLATFVGAEDRGDFRAAVDLLTRDQVSVTLELRVTPRQSLIPAWVAVSASRALGRQGTASALRWLLRDITKLKHDHAQHQAQAADVSARLRERTAELVEVRAMLEHSLARERQQRQRLEATSEKQQKLLAAVAHELRGPLSSIAGWVQVMGGERPEAATMSRAIASVTRSTRALTRLVEELLDYTRNQAGLFPLDCRLTSLSELLTRSLDAIQPAAIQKQVRLTSDIPQLLPEIFADPQRLEQVVTNLLGNAIKFTAANGEVRLSARYTVSHFEIVVRDNGAGIDSKFLGHVFDAFSRIEHGDFAARGDGLGLGLHISRWLVKLHGGSIEVASEGRGLGTTLSVKLPAPAQASRAISPDGR